MSELDSEELFMQELKKEFYEKTSKSLKLMPELFEKSDYLEIRKIAHDIKGTAGIFEMEQGSELGRNLQEAADNADRDEVKRLIDELIVYMRAEGVEI